MPTERTSKKTSVKKSVTKSSKGSAPLKKAAAKKAAVPKAPATGVTEEAPKKNASATTQPSGAATKAPTKKVAKKTASSTDSKSVQTKSQAKNLPKFLTDDAWLESQRDELLEERRKYTHNAALLVAEANALMADREPGDVQFDEESGEGDTLAVERDRDLALSSKALENVAAIDAALARLNAGTYGICVKSGDIIPRERLEAIPWASKTVAAQTSMF
ncbi:MAG: RNA polymerase-binding transcription factor DksA [Acidimicrobiales bacterium]|jgi:RNA polymerase-binding transcription factor DksA